MTIATTLYGIGGLHFKLFYTRCCGLCVTLRYGKALRGLGGVLISLRR